MSLIFLYGPPGTGKSTIGRKLARNLRLPFVDLDRLIETQAGMSIPQIMQQQGEDNFRQLESEALQELVSTEPQPRAQVIALGGGALLRPENRLLAERHGTVVLLMAEWATLVERLRSDAGRRPLLAGDLHTNLRRLLDSRREHYDSFPLRVNASTRTVIQNVQKVQALLGRHRLTAMGDYDVIVGPVSRLADFPLQRPVVVTDEHVARLHGGDVLAYLREAGHSPGMITVPAGEAHKNLETVQSLWNAFLEHGLDRSSTVLAVGGGVVGDMAGFAAATYMRGIPWACLPTTLLSMVDASLGGKTGIDLPRGKNLVGSFHPPAFVLADPQLLQTLPGPEFVSGLAEVVKHGIIGDPDLFALCARGRECIDDQLEHVVKRAMAVKIRIIEEDPYEKGFRAALNLGHTVGHAVELVSGFRLRHGEAVAIGLVAEARFSERMGVARGGLADEIARALAGLGLPVDIPSGLPRPDILRAMQVDKKKHAAGIRFALPAEVGRVELVDVTDLEAVL